MNIASIYVINQTKYTTFTHLTAQSRGIVTRAETQSILPYTHACQHSERMNANFLTLYTIHQRNKIHLSYCLNNKDSIHQLKHVVFKWPTLISPSNFKTSFTENNFLVYCMHIKLICRNTAAYLDYSTRCTLRLTSYEPRALISDAQTSYGQLNIYNSTYLSAAITLWYIDMLQSINLTYRLDQIST